MTTVGFMSAKMPATFMVDDDVAVRLLEKASEAGKAKNEVSSKYVNRLLKWALENYNEVRDNVAEQVSNS
jgi:hypothetical protein